MATSTSTLKLAKATEKEISQVRDLLNELSALNKYYTYDEVIEVLKENEEEFPVLSKLDTTDNSEFLTDLCRHVANIRFECVMFNLSTLMDNCADPNLDHLDFNPDIKRGLQLLDLEEQGKLLITE
jgi:hypothetical protein